MTVAVAEVQRPSTSPLRSRAFAAFGETAIVTKRVFFPATRWQSGTRTRVTVLVVVVVVVVVVETTTKTTRISVIFAGVHGRTMSPIRRCAGSALRLTEIVTNGFVVELVRWQIVVFPGAAVVVVVAAVDVAVVAVVVVCAVDVAAVVVVFVVVEVVAVVPVEVVLVACVPSEPLPAAIDARDRLRGGRRDRARIHRRRDAAHRV